MSWIPDLTSGDFEAAALILQRMGLLDNVDAGMAFDTVCATVFRTSNGSIAPIEGVMPPVDEGERSGGLEYNANMCNNTLTYYP